MEKYMTKVRVLTWVVIALTVLNITTLSTIFWHKYQFRHDEGRDKDRFQMNEPRRMGKLFDQKLHLTKEQKEQFGKIHFTFRESSHKIINDMQLVRKNMIDEMKKKNIDTTVLYNYAQNIGSLHAQMKKQTVQLYLQLKTVCTPQQQDSLAIIFSGILQNEGMPFPQRRGMRIDKKQDFKDHRH